MRRRIVRGRGRERGNNRKHEAGVQCPALGKRNGNTTRGVIQREGTPQPRLVDPDVGDAQAATNTTPQQPGPVLGCQPDSVLGYEPDSAFTCAMTRNPSRKRFLSAGSSCF